MQTDRAEQVEPGSCLEELRREARVGAEEQAGLPVNDAGVEVRDGHWRRPDGGFAVDLGMVLRHDRRVIGAQPESTDREATVAADLGDPRLLQQRQGGTAGADEHETGRQLNGGAADLMPHADMPETIAPLGQAGDLVLQLQCRTGLHEPVDEEMGQRAEIDVGARCDPGGRDRLVFVTARDQQGRPGADHLGIVAELHALEERVILQCLVALLEIRDVGLAPDEAHVRDRIDEPIGLGQ